jgi:hypothetical protein
MLEKTMKKFLTMFFILYLAAVGLFAQVPKQYQGNYTSNQFANGQYFDPPIVFNVEENTITLDGEASNIEEIDFNDQAAYILLDNGLGFKYLFETGILYIVDIDNKKLIMVLKMTRLQVTPTMSKLQDTSL